MSLLRTNVLKSSRAKAVVGGHTRRTYATERPPPPTRQPVVEVFSGPSRLRSSRPYATETTRTEAQKQAANEPIVELFADSARPRPYYAKHPPFRDLPKAKSNGPIIATAVALGLAGWGAFYAYATNQEKLSSSVYRSIIRAIKVDPQLRAVLGEAIRPQPEWYLNGDPLIHGQISQIQGNIDVSFRVKGSQGAGTLYFTSIRKEKGIPFTVLRFKVICDDGTVVNISDVAPAV